MAIQAIKGFPLISWVKCMGNAIILHITLACTEELVMLQTIYPMEELPVMEDKTDIHEMNGI